MARRPAPVIDPALSLQRGLKMRAATLTLAVGSGVATAVFAALWPLQDARPWLSRSLAEGLVFAGSVAVFALILALLSWIYLIRPSRALGGVPAASSAAERPNLLLQLVALAGLIAIGAVLVWFEYRYQAVLTNNFTLREAIGLGVAGRPIPSGVGMVGTLLMVIATFSARRWWLWARRGPA
jgi:hypothetical protein